MPKLEGLYVKAHKPVPARKTILEFVENFCATSETAGLQKKFIRNPQNIDYV